VSTSLAGFRVVLASPDFTLRVVVGLCAVSVIIRTLELLARASLFGPQGSLSWKLVQELCPFECPPWFTALCDGRGLLAVLIVRLAASAGLLVPARPFLLLACLTIVALSSLMLNLRMPVGQDGSDQMNVLIVLPAWLAILCGQDLAKIAVLMFIAGQGSLAYATSGVAKLGSPLWRSGEAIPQIMSTLAYGNGLAARALCSSLALRRTACWSVILFETCFSFSVLAGPHGLLGVLAVGLLFHVSCAILMGLNCFLWSFLATYPALIFTSNYLFHLLHTIGKTGG